MLMFCWHPARLGRGSLVGASSSKSLTYSMGEAPSCPKGPDIGTLIDSTHATAISAPLVRSLRKKSLVCEPSRCYR